MPFSDAVPSISGRNSRASNVSAMTGTSQLIRVLPQAGVPNETMSNAGVLSMLKTSTDTGDIGALSFNTPRLPSMPRPVHPRRSHTSHPPGSAHSLRSGSGSYHHHAPSQNSRQSSQWDGVSAQRRGSLASMRSMPPALVHAPYLGHTIPRMPPPVARSSRDSRSYSLTSAAPAQSLPQRRSANSLRSRAHDPRLLPQAPPEYMPPVPGSRSPLVYPTRLRRPGFRSPSPALSDMYASGMPSQAGPPFTTVRAPGPQIMPSSYHTADQDSHEPRHLSVRQPPRVARSSPGEAIYDPTQLPYRPALMRPSPPAANPRWGPSSSERSNQYAGTALADPALIRAPSYSSSPLAPRSGHVPYLPARYQDHRGPRPPPDVAPAAHHMFHNAARQARNLPHRIDTPIPDLGPSSSDPPSSRSLPSSSQPPTPRDYHRIQVTVNSALADPVSADLPDPLSEPLYSTRYFDYVEGIDKPVGDADLEVSHPSAPPAGFVQRVKAMLESKAVEDTTTRRSNSGGAQGIHELATENSHVGGSEARIFYELATDETPRFAFVEQPAAPYELPTSPAETPAADIFRSSGEPFTQRITRDVIKAELGPSSADNTLERPDIKGSPHIVVEARRDHKDDRPTNDLTTKQPKPANDDDLISVTSTADSARTGSKSDETASTISVRASLPSGADYALRFTVHLDSTRSSAETYSKDHFGLDAESAQRRESAVRTSRDRKPSTLQNSTVPSPESGRNEPVSPLKPEDYNMNRNSAVSPCVTQTLAIGPTRPSSAAENSEHHSTDQPSIPGSFPDDPSPPPTPRAPKAYAKSVRLPPSATTPTDTASTNRYSLPGDLSSIGDTSTNTTTEMVTDVAVRFSLPQTAATSTKPQIVDVAASATPDGPKDEWTPPPGPNQCGRKGQTRNSVTFADEVAPLAVSRKPEPLRSPPQDTDQSTSAKGRPIIRKPSPRDSQATSDYGSLDLVADLRFPLATNNAHGPNHRSGNQQLPDLKEETTEDMSAADPKRTSGLLRDLRFPIPARIAAVKAMQDRRMKDSGERAQARRTLRHRHQTLAEIRDLPSLNFSRMDLIDKLNEALDVRTTRSLDVVRHQDFPNLYCPSPQRPQSTEPLRERYMSFFSKPEAFGADQAPITEADGNEQRVRDADLSSTDDLESSDEEDEPAMANMSPEMFLTFAQEVNRLSIPSVAGLSERLSELIPGLRNLHSLQLDSLFGPWSDNGSVNGNEYIRPDTVLSNRTSTGFRALAERAEEIVKNGTHDSVQSTKPLALNKALPLLPESVSADNITAGHKVADVKQSYLSGSVSVPTDLGKEVSRPPSAVVRGRTPTTEEEVRELLPQAMNPIARAAQRSATVSQASNRPWNLDENYPWAADDIEIDLRVPPPAFLADPSPSKTGALDKSVTRSLESTTSAEPTGATRGNDTGFLTEPNDTRGSTMTEQLTGPNPKHLRRSSKLSIIGSITRKLGFTDHRTNDSEESTTQILTSGYPLPLASSTTHTSYQSAGDRYPTSGLSPPDGFNLDEVRSFFSDNSSENGGGRTPSLRMRLAQLKGKRKTVRIQAPESLSSDGDGRHYHHHPHHDSRPVTYDAGSILFADPRAGFSRSAPTTRSSTMPSPYQGVLGMSKTEFQWKRFGEKLRHLLARGGELLRSWSLRSRVRKPGPPSPPPPPPAAAVTHEDWMADLGSS